MNATTVGEQAKPGDFFRFVADVNAILLELTAVSYAEVMRSIHPGGDAPKHAHDAGLAPSEFVSGLIADERFLERGGPASDEEVRGHNIVMAALAEFVYESEGWHRSADGTYFATDGENTMTIRPVADRHEGRYGFGVEVWSGSSGSIDHPVTPDMGEPVARFAGYDIANPVAQAVEHVASARQFRF